MTEWQVTLVTVVQDVVPVLVLAQELKIVFAAFNFRTQHLLNHVPDRCLDLPFGLLFSFLSFLLIFLLFLISRLIPRHIIFLLHNLNSKVGQKKLLGQQRINNGDRILFNLLNQVLDIGSAVVSGAEVDKYLWEDFVFFLHFLVMTSALLCFSSAYKFGHAGKNAVHAAQTAVHEVGMVDFEEPMVSLVLFD